VAVGVADPHASGMLIQFFVKGYGGASQLGIVVLVRGLKRPLIDDLSFGTRREALSPETGMSVGILQQVQKNSTQFFAPPELVIVE